jgi:single-stranded-DNA-specific exonuclease
MRGEGYRWIPPSQVDEDRRRVLSERLGVSPLFAGILMGRGFSEIEAMQAYLSPDMRNTRDPFLMRDMEAAVGRILQALQRKEGVLVHGDYDVDGLTAVALLVKVLSGLGLSVAHYIPNRLSEGYGVSPEGLYFAKKAGASLVITVDCGIVANEETELARRLGLECIITDHHEAGPCIPGAVAVLDPKRPDCNYPDKELAGIGVAYKLCQALYRSLGREEEELERFLDMVALGTIADVAPLLGENRVFVAKGLEVMQKSPNLAVAALLRSAGLLGKRFSASHVAFTIAPRINAVGRMGASQGVVDFLVTESPKDASAMAAVLEQENKKRQRVDSQVLMEARQMLEGMDIAHEWTIVLSSRTWHPGVLGIVASRLVERFSRPIILITLDENGIGRGSARSIPSFHLHDALTSCKEYLIEYGGHQHAAGLKIKAENIEEFRVALNRHAHSVLTPLSLIREIRIDAEVSVEDFGDRLLAEIKRTAPNGPANPKPLFLLRGVGVDGYPRMVGEGHLRMSLKKKGKLIDAIGFNLGDMAGTITARSAPLDVVFSLDENTWQGKTRIQAKIKDLRITNAHEDHRR